MHKQSVFQIHVGKAILSRNLASKQLGLSEVRVADREATSYSGGLHDGHIPLQTVQTHAGWPKQSSLNPGADDFVMRDVTLIYGGLLRPDLDQDWDSVQEAHAGGLRQGGGVDSRLWGNVHPQGVVQCGQVAQEASRHVEPDVSLMDGYLGSGLAVPVKPLLRKFPKRQSHKIARSIFY